MMRFITRICKNRSSRFLRSLGSAFGARANKSRCEVAVDVEQHVGRIAHINIDRAIRAGGHNGRIRHHGADRSSTSRHSASLASRPGGQVRLWSSEGGTTVKFNEYAATVDGIPAAQELEGM